MRASPVAALFLFAACATSPGPALPPLPPLARLSIPPLDYTAELSDKGLLDDGPLRYDPAPGGVGSVEDMVGIRCTVLNVDRRTALELTGSSGLRAFSTHASEARELVRACRERDPASLVSSPGLILNDGQAGYVTIMNKTAYVAGFRLVQEERTLLADPLVDTLSHGLLLEASASAVRGPDPAQSASRVALAVSLRLADLHLPIAQHEIALAGGTSTVTLQEPLLSRQRLETELELGADECLVLIAEDLERSGRMLVSLVTARRLTPEELHLFKSNETGALLEQLCAAPG